MNEVILNSVVVASLFGSLFSSTPKNETEVYRAVNYGAMSKLTFRVTDSQGMPVEDVDAGAGFWLATGKPSGAAGKTDANGIVSLEGLSSGDGNYGFTKDGYYSKLT